MEGEIRYFRKSFIGGFNRDDVVAYIAQLSRERNDAVADAERMRADLSDLQEENAALKKRLEHYDSIMLNREAPVLPSISPEPQYSAIPAALEQLSELQNNAISASATQLPEKPAPPPEHPKPVIIIKRKKS